MTGIYIHPERSLECRCPYEIEDRMQGISDTCLEIELFRSLHRRSGTHGQHIWIELIGPLIWLLEDRIIKIQIKPGHGIRYLHIE